MKTKINLAIALAVTFGFSASANASLAVIGIGTIGTAGSYNLIYDTASNITWLDYTNTTQSSGDNIVSDYVSSTYSGQASWASELSVNIGGTSYSGWALPTITDLHNLYPQIQAPNTNPFQYLANSIYRSGTAYDAADSWVFNFSDDTSSVIPDSYSAYGDYGIAVMSGEPTISSVPLPSSLLLLVSGVAVGVPFTRRGRSAESGADA